MHIIMHLFDYLYSLPLLDKLRDGSMIKNGGGQLVRKKGQFTHRRHDMTRHDSIRRNTTDNTMKNTHWFITNSDI